MDLNNFEHDRHLRTAKIAYESLHRGHAKFQDLSDVQKREWRSMAKTVRFMVIGELLTDGGYSDILVPPDDPPRCSCGVIAPLGSDVCPQCEAEAAFASNPASR